MKVVRLLEDMRAELQKEMDDDKAVYEELTCWCKANDKEKSQAIEMGNQRVEQLKASLSETAAKVVELKSKRADTKDEIAADQKALDTAQALRFKENQAFHAEETDLIEAVKACKQAVIVLSKHNPSLTQVQSAAHILQVAKVEELATSLGQAPLLALKEFIQGAATGSSPSFLGVPGFQSYAPRSSQIFGILQQMQSDFESRLSDSQKSELKAQEEFSELKTAKRDEIDSGNKQVVEIDAELAALGEKAAQETKELEDVQEQLGLDTEFLANLRKKCTMTDEEFQSRTKSRTEEILAVEETIKILNTDEAFNLFDKTTTTDTEAPALLQISSDAAASDEAQLRVRASAADVLRRAAAKTGAPAMAFLAASVQLDAFTKVKAEIDKLVTELKKQQQDEVEHRDWCIEELAVNKRSTEAGYDAKEALQTKIADLEQEIKELDAKAQEVRAASAEAEKQMKRASEVREGENADFQLTVGDQRMTQIILQKAIGRMSEVYALLQGDKPGAPHIATSGNHTDPGNGPARFTKYEKHAGGSRVVMMLEKVLADSQQLENEAMKAEEDAQSAYESFMKDSNKSVKKYAETLVNLQAADATAKASLSMAETDLKETLKELEGLNAALGDLKSSCDFLLKNFDARQAARTAEMEALKEAKAILSGAAL